MKQEAAAIADTASREENSACTFASDSTVKSRQGVSTKNTSRLITYWA